MVNHRGQREAKAVENESDRGRAKIHVEAKLQKHFRSRSVQSN